MHFYYCFFALIFTVLKNSATDRNTELVYPECGLIRPSPSSIGLVFFVIINNTSNKTNYDIEVTPDECCLEIGDKVDCDSLQIIGGCKDHVSRGKTKLIKVVAPTLSQYNRKGNCAVYVDSKSGIGKNKRDAININFDTRSYNNKFYNYKDCKHEDDDPFNDCKPVNCDTRYNGVKPHFSRKAKRCVAVPPCVKEYDYEYDYPSVIYNPQTNQCIEESIVDGDLEHVKTFNKDCGNKRKHKDVLIINKFNPNKTSFLPNDILIDDIETTTIKKLKKTTINKLQALNLKAQHKSIINSYKDTDRIKSFLNKYFVDSYWTSITLVLVIVAQCLLICTMIYYLQQTCNCCKQKKNVRKFFNYRQDASVTTPLIHTSNIDTETTEFQHLSESSNNADQKVKCYKACQLEKTNAKKSMSDDILSKLLNGRDWKKNKSQAKTELDNVEETIKHFPESNQVHNVPKHVGKIINETKVILENEKDNNVMFKKQTTYVKEDNHTDNDRNDQGSEENISSEKEIQCHSYNRFHTDIAEYRAGLATNTGILKDDKSRKGTSNSSEKGAQAYFSNDSIDDFLSERGVIYLAGENMTKYTFSSGSNELRPSLTSSATSKTSKNFVKNVLSLLNKRSKQGPSSDPGQKKDIDLELLHMSRASVYSSTNGSDCVKNFKRKDSRTSY
ncbi:uncharacterized protein LOC112042825 [Bicyclus anynana]|uniref:Uncharacterized protein LOC112042825 n=1 Tax=Bicyclus anynana TaxID=110368 RepID=A0A6J1MLY4_BICAN|nr:uncharacterized protein LOC112042825 [Bicyclus anynana]